MTFEKLWDFTRGTTALSYAKATNLWKELSVSLKRHWKNVKRVTEILISNVGSQHKN